MSEKGQEFRWTAKATQAALALAEGQTRAQAAARADISERQLYRWLADEDFTAEVDRLSLASGIASRAERLRIAQRAARQMVNEDGTVKTEKDLLDWLKFAQSETNGAKFGITSLSLEYDIKECTDEELNFLIAGGDPHEMIRNRRQAA